MNMISKIYGHARQRDGEELKRDGWSLAFVALRAVGSGGFARPAIGPNKARRRGAMQPLRP